MVVDHSETGVKKNTYQNNTEWEMMKVTVERKEVGFKMFCRVGPRALLYKFHLLQSLTGFRYKAKDHMFNSGHNNALDGIN